MTNLTDKWKKGELPFGWYYIKIADIVFIDFFDGKVWKNKKDKYIDEVLAEVPSYDEYQKLLSDQLAKNEGIEINAELEAENTKLKELLKECRGLFNRSTVDGEEPNNAELIMILTKIDEVLK